MKTNGFPSAQPLYLSLFVFRATATSICLFVHFLSSIQFNSFHFISFQFHCLEYHRKQRKSICNGFLFCFILVWFYFLLCRWCCPCRSQIVVPFKFITFVWPFAYSILRLCLCPDLAFYLFRIFFHKMFITSFSHVVCCPISLAHLVFVFMKSIQLRNE